MVGREDLIGWLKVRVLIVVDLINIIKFLWEDFIYQYKVFMKFISDGDFKNKV